MADTILFPDATLAAITCLSGALDDRASPAIVRSRVPNPRPDLFVTVRRIGGVQRNLVVDQAMLSVEAWATLDEDAHDLAQLCRGILNAAEGTAHSGTLIYRCDEIGGPALLPDPDSDQPRYVATYLIATRGLAG